MPHHHGYRSKTRDLFAKPYRRHGTIPLSKLMVAYRRGDLVDIKIDGAVQKGMAHKFYHGKTGRVFNIAPHAVGVIINKQVKQRIIQKKVHVRPEHIQKSRSREDFLIRVHENEAKKNQGSREELKRQPKGPREAHFIESKLTEVVDQMPPIYKFDI
mgnify:FL=1